MGEKIVKRTWKHKTFMCETVMDFDAKFGEWLNSVSKSTNFDIKRFEPVIRTGGRFPIWTTVVYTI